MPQIHPKARTTHATRVEIARSTEPNSILAKRYGISAGTVRKWRKRGVADCLDHSSLPRRLLSGRQLVKDARSSAPCGVQPTSLSMT
jgi:transposase-like protein